MPEEKSFFEKYYLFLFFLVFLTIDCWLLYHRQYASRKFIKPLLVPTLLLWFMSNTAFNVRSSPDTLTARLSLYAIFTFTFIADICGLTGDAFVWNAAMMLYSLSSVICLGILISIQKNVTKEKKFAIRITNALPSLVIIGIFAALYIHKVFELDLNLYYYWLCVYAFILSLLAGLTTNMWSLPVLKDIRPLFFLSISFLIVTQAIYGIDEVIYHRRHPILDVIVAISNAFSQIFLILGIIKFLRLKKG